MKTMDNDDLLERAKRAVSDLFGDRCVSKSTTKANLEDIISDCQTMIDSLGADED